MSKHLSDILKGVKSSTVEPGSTGKDAAVDYKPKSKAEQDFVAKHKTEKHANRVGNGPDVFNGAKIKTAPFKKQSKDVYEHISKSKKKL